MVGSSSLVAATQVYRALIVTLRIELRWILGCSEQDLDLWVKAHPLISQKDSLEALKRSALWDREATEAWLQRTISGED